MAIVVDTGGTSFDVSVVRNGRIPRTRETWLGERFVGHITGFPSVDVRTSGCRRRQHRLRSTPAGC